MNKQSESLRILMDLLKQQEGHKLPLTKAKEKLQSLIPEENAKVIAEQAIEEALDELMIEKVLDYDETDKDSTGHLVWFLRIPNKERREQLENLSEEDRTFLRILYNSESHDRPGAIPADVASEKLQEVGVGSDYVPFIPGLTYDFFKNGDGESVMYHYLLAENEKDREFMT
ncbi:MAG: hypothetical protein KGY80_00870 [Candidatus Thorarchaeota archaeon]|nr:hypothetical protein [Candidatus Thorarchaeota archaeon]